MNSHVIERYKETAVNCLTGSYATLAGIIGRSIEEQVIFERGDGYLFQAGLDESGYPEYIFPVEETGALGMARSGFTVHADAIDPAAPGAQLTELIGARRGVVVWVNTAHLGYADAYRDNDPYLHAVVIERVADAGTSVQVSDCLVVDSRPFSCRAELTLPELVKATSDRIRSEAHDGMGYFYTATDEGAPLPAALGESVSRQATRYFAEERFLGAIRRYRDMCLDCFAGPPERATRAARRLFHHASVLYAVPSLTLMGRSLRTAGAAESTLDLHAEAIRHWTAIGVLAIRFEATGAASVLARVERRFAELDDVTDRLWTALRDQYGDAVPDAR